MNENTLLFKFLISLDRMANVLHGGGFQECISTHAYRRHRGGSKYWTRVMRVIDFLFRDDVHCKNSFEWEIELKRTYVKDNEHLLQGSK